MEGIEMRYLKTLGLMLIAAFAMSAMTASAASAQNGVFTADEYPVTITGEEEEAHPLIFVSGLEIACATEQFHADLSAASDELTLTPSYSNCVAPGIPAQAFVSMTGCDFNLYNLETNEEAPSGTYLSTADLVCPEGKSVDIDIPLGVSAGCRVTVPGQAGLEHVKFWNTPHETSADTDDIDMTLTVGGITTTRENLSPTQPCPFGHAHSTTATYEGGVTLTGEDENEDHVGIRISD